VLPFANLSGDPEFEYLSDGIAEDIINALAQLAGLRVAARTSSFAFRGRAVDLAEVGAKLKVAMVLEGSVRKAGNRLRVTAQLVKVSDGDHLWSERYDRDMTDIFAIQDEIAKAIAGRLQVTLDGGEAASLVTPATKNLDAYHLCLRGRYLLAQRGLGLKQALECFGQAIALDPSYALAHAGLAEACTVLAQYGLVPPGTLRAKAHAAACRALELAPTLAEAHAAAGTVAEVEAIRDELTARARRAYVQYTMLAILSAALGRLDEAFELLEHACDDRDGILVYSRRYPFFSAFQHDPRMERIYRRIGL